MQSYIILGALLGLPLVLGVLFRVSASHLFFALLSGELIERYFSEDARLIANSFIKNDAASEYVSLGLLLLPVLLTALFLQNTLSHGKVFLHIIPLAITGIVSAVFALHLLPGSLQGQIYATEAGRMLRDMTDMIIAGMVTLQLVSLWLLNRSSEGHRKHKKH